MPTDRSRRFGGEMTPGELMGIGFIADGRDEALTATRENLRAGATQIKVMAGEGTGNAFTWARKYSVKPARGTDLMFLPAQMANQNSDILGFRT